MTKLKTLKDFDIFIKEIYTKGYTESSKKYTTPSFIEGDICSIECVSKERGLK